MVYVDLPEPGRMVEMGSTVAEVESTKSVSEIYAPISGTIIEINEALADSPDLRPRPGVPSGQYPGQVPVQVSVARS